MKRLLLALLCLFAAPARADDAITGFGWNAVTGTFQALTRSLGWKSLPDYDSGTFIANFTGPRSTSDTVTYLRIGKTVVLTFPSDNSSACSSALAFTAAAATLPASLRPSGSIYNGSIAVYDNSGGVTTAGNVTLTAAGAISINKDWATGRFTATGTCGWYAGSIAYSIQ